MYINEEVVDILIADDEAVVRNMLMDFLSNAFKNVRLHFARNGVETVRKYNESRPSIILLDYNIPLLNGKKVFQKIRRNNPDSNFIIISPADQRIKDYFIKSGVIACINKPFAMSYLIKVIREFMEYKNYKYG